MKHTKTLFNCDLCGAELPEDYINTDGEGGRYFAHNAYNEIPLTQPIDGCKSMIVKVTVGGKEDNRRFTDLCDKCRLDLLKQAVAYLEQKVGGD